MKIIILGAGQVGGTLAENLVGENNDITIVDTDGERLRELQDKYDLRVVNGHGAHPGCCAKPAPRMRTCWWR
jgi:trk system potassium uptake protein